MPYSLIVKPAPAHGAHPGRRVSAPVNSSHLVRGARLYISHKMRFLAAYVYVCDVVTDNGLGITAKRHRVPALFDYVINIEY